MKKTINISLGGYSFQIEEDAYSVLDKYLSDIKAHFSEISDTEEIVSDIEARMAEQFREKLTGSKIIRLPLVEELIAIMGSPAQLSGEETKNEKKQASSGSHAFGKRLYRNQDDVLIAGVSSGLAAYIGNIDPIWVRLVFVLLTLSGGFGIPLYILLWIIMPEAKTETEKMQMRGQAINLKNVENVIKERVDEFKKKDQSKIKNLFAAPFAALGIFIRAVATAFKHTVPFLGRLLGIIFTFASALMIAALLFLGLNLLLNTGSPYIDFPVKEIAGTWEYHAAVISGFFAALSPLIVLLFLASSLAALKLNLNKAASLALLGIFIVSFSVFATLALRLAPKVENAYQNSGYAKQETKILELKDFKGIEASGNYEVMAKKGSEYKVTITGAISDLGETNIYVEKQNLIASRTNNIKFCIFCIKHPVKVEIEVPEINRLKAEGSSKIFASGFSAQNLEIALSGASRAEVKIEAEMLKAKLSGASRLSSLGRVQNFNLELSGASRFNADRSPTQNSAVNAKLSGASRAYFLNLKSLIAELSGASKIYFFEAGNISQKLSGSSRLVPNYSSGLNEDFEYFYLEETSTSSPGQTPTSPSSTSPSM